jgi:SAM-dependent methyltransferase
MDHTAARFADPEFVATYLHAEWGDVLFPGAGQSTVSLHSETLEGCDGQPGRFYRQAALVVKQWAADLDLLPGRICDVGGGTGRTIFEMARQFPSATELVLAEPSGPFCGWARQLLQHDKEGWQVLPHASPDGWIPVPAAPGRPAWRKAVVWPPPVDGLQICQVPAAGVPRPPGYFDLVTCLNVADRVADPRQLIRGTLALVRPGGLAVLACPFDWQERFTPRSEWFTDWREVLPAGSAPAGRVVDLRYEFLRQDRRLVAYLTQMIGVVVK